MLASPRLPRAAQTILLNYIHEKSQGAYGHNYLQRQRFIAQLEAVMASHIGSEWVILDLNRHAISYAHLIPVYP